MAATSETLGSLHEALTKQLLDRINAGEATAADMAVARGLLKDNSITCIPKESSAISELEKRLAERDKVRKFPRLVQPSTAEDLAAAAEAAGFMVSHGT